MEDIQDKITESSSFLLKQGFEGVSIAIVLGTGL